MTQFLPPNLLALFAPRDPIPYLPPASKLPHEKKNGGYIGVGCFLKYFEVLSDTLRLFSNIRPECETTFRVLFSHKLTSYIFFVFLGGFCSCSSNCIGNDHFLAFLFLLFFPL